MARAVHSQLPNMRIALALEITALMAMAAPAAEIAGKVVLSGKPAADAVISIEEPRLDGPASTELRTVDHRDLNFTPHVVVVRAGSSVQLKNSDRMPCRLYSISPAGTFAMRSQDGKPMTVKFDRPGVIELRCADHARIHAYVVVKENGYFAVTDTKGRYDLRNVPPGQYKIQLWYEGKAIDSRTVTVKSRKVTLDFHGLRPERDEGVASGPPSHNLSDSVFIHSLEAMQ